MLKRLLRCVVRTIHIVKVIHVRIGWKDEMRSKRWLGIGGERRRIMQGRCGREIWMDLSAIGIEQDFKSVAWVWLRG